MATIDPERARVTVRDHTCLDCSLNVKTYAKSLAGWPAAYLGGSLGAEYTTE